jgi:hypothetical protein
VHYIHHEANRVAHRLAKLALTLGMDKVWRDEFPKCMHDIVSTEQAVS